MSHGERLPLFPSRANLVLMKQRILSATRGLSMLKRRRDALEMKLREMRAELRGYKDKLNGVMQAAYLSMARANYFGTDFKPASVQHTERAEAFLRLRSTRVVGLLLPTFLLELKPSTVFPLTGLSRGGLQVVEVRKCFQDALDTLVALASLEYSVKVLKEGVRQNNMRVNGLEFVVVPRFINTVNYIRDELDEFEREDFYRLKRSQAKQRRNKAAFAKVVKMKNMTPEELERLANLEKMPKSGVGETPFNIEDFHPSNGEKRNSGISIQTSFVLSAASDMELK